VKCDRARFHASKHCNGVLSKSGIQFMLLVFAAENKGYGFENIIVIAVQKICCFAFPYSFYVFVAICIFAFQ
jgi:hypothetical protein